MSKNAMTCQESSPSPRAGDAYLERLDALCACDSPTGDLAAVDQAADLLLAWAADAGLVGESFETAAGRHVRIRLDGTGTGRRLLLGHHDTVWPRGTAAVRRLRVEGGRAFAPGAADMKGGLLVGLAALEVLAEGPRDEFASVELHSLPDEEARIGPPARIDLLAGAERAIVLECGRENGAIVSSRSAASWIRVVAAGRAAHAGVDLSRGRSALHAAIAELQRIEALPGARPELQISATRLVAAGPANAVPDRAEMSFDVRAPSADALARAIGEIGRFGAHPGVAFEASSDPGFPAMQRWEPLIALALAELADAGARALEQHALGASDGCWTSSLGIPTLDGLGPVGGADHTEAEWVDLDSIGPRIEVVARLCTSAALTSNTEEER